MLCLQVPTDPEWADAALGDVDAVLADHAHCELKAASSALSLATRHAGHADVARALTDLAREEIEHFQQVLDRLSARGVRLGPPPVDRYVAELRAATGKLARSPGDVERAALVDRLLVGALIEARSCERFRLLSQAAERSGRDAEERALWADLLASEARHYRTFVDLAVGVAEQSREQVLERLAQLAMIEGAIVARLGEATPGASRASIHG